MSITNLDNRNFQSSLTFDFKVDKLSDFNFYVQRVNIPSVSLPIASGGANPFVKIPYPGDHLDFAEISIEFKVSEGMYNWYEIFSWMQGLGFPENQKQYGNLKQGKTLDLNNSPITPLIIPKANGAIYSQGTLVLNTSQNNPSVKITFIDMYPVNLSEIVLDARDAEMSYLTATVSFKYDYFTVEKLV